MVQPAAVLMGCLMFALGLAIGLVFHLPMTSSPQGSRSRESRDLGPKESSTALDEITIDNVLISSDPRLKGTVDKLSVLKVNSHHDRAPYTVKTSDSRHSLVTNSQVGVDQHEETLRAPAKTVTVKMTTKDDRITKKNTGPAQIQTHKNVTNLSAIVHGIYWSDEAEALVPEGFTSQDLEQWRKKLEKNKVVDVTEGCGRMQNRQLVLSDATKACARYRLNTDQIQGEIYSFYLSKVLGMDHVPPSVLLGTDPRAETWRRVSHALSAAKWAPDKVAIVTPWLSDVRPAYIPKEFQTQARELLPTEDHLQAKTSEEIRELVQWSDLIVFDFLTANLDRVVNNMYNHQWNPDMMRSPAHNLERVPSSGLLVFLDNESGLFHSYRLLDKYGGYHDALLRSLCVFRATTAAKIKELHHNGQVGALIMERFRTEEPLADRVPKLPDRTIKILQQRVAIVAQQIANCEARYDR